MDFKGQLEFSNLVSISKLVTLYDEGSHTFTISSAFLFGLLYILLAMYIFVLNYEITNVYILF